MTRTELPVTPETKDRLESYKPDDQSMDAFLNRLLRDAQNFRCMHDLVEELQEVDQELEETRQSFEQLRSVAETLESAVARAEADDD